MTAPGVVKEWDDGGWVLGGAGARLVLVLREVTRRAELARHGYRRPPIGGHKGKDRVWMVLDFETGRVLVEKIDAPAFPF